ncbi:MAG: hypothetical protein KatS3mg112_0279 [Thermogutta sp.]|nr:MAG: hypothetical protein KatS3mg112_0279 [Thermogutta sp.]
MVDHGGHVAARIILGDVPDRVQVVRQRPLYRFVSPIVNIFLGQNLIDRRAPEVTLPQVAYLHVARVGTPEIRRDASLLGAPRSTARFHESVVSKTTNESSH